MNVQNLKALLDACFLAKRIVETLPELPDHMKPRHIHVLNVVHEVQQQQNICRVSDVSRSLSITMPSVTRLVQELEQLEMLEKHPDREDGRITLLSLTKKGEACVLLYVTQFHSAWAEALDGITDEQAQEAVHIIEELWRTMPSHIDPAKEPKQA